MEKNARVSEPALNRWDQELAEEGLDEGRAGLEIFRLSGGVLGSANRTSNRIDGLLIKMLSNPSSGRYLGNIDRNLDFLYTSLQLDLIGRVAEDVSLKNIDVVEIQKPSEELELSLDRARSSV